MKYHPQFLSIYPDHVVNCILIIYCVLILNVDNVFTLSKLSYLRARGVIGQLEFLLLIYSFMNHPIKIIISYTPNARNAHDYDLKH